MFEGMGLGGCILQAEYGARMKAGLVFFFATTMPFGVALGLVLTRVYRDNSPTALVVVGLLNAASAGLLHYMALVELLAADFLGAKLQGSVRLELVCLAAVLLGAGAMPRPSAIVLQAPAAYLPDPPREHHFQPEPARSGR
ncbi:Fe(2+) transport protein 1 [Hordeum vulgare]|nr:Fe(2+) transport protein 1 [Hordeum vulgare]